ncbi:MAG: hypothetical protein GX999_09130 [Bacteroidales bacterium]|jgi:hypothetical protein|nr:hypothetical protein [Bacteroidales bacterium]
MSPHFFVVNIKRQLIHIYHGVNNPRNTAKATVNDPDKALNETHFGNADIYSFYKFDRS